MVVVCFGGAGMIGYVRRRVLGLVFVILRCTVVELKCRTCGIRAVWAVAALCSYVDYCYNCALICHGLCGSRQAKNSLWACAKGECAGWSGASMFAYARRYVYACGVHFLSRLFSEPCEGCASRQWLFLRNFIYMRTFPTRNQTYGPRSTCASVQSNQGQRYPLNSYGKYFW